MAQPFTADEIRQFILDDISRERDYQDEKWGAEFDDKNTINDWVSYIAAYAAGAADMGIRPRQQRVDLLKTAALAVAAIEAFDRNGGFAPRHYEEDD